MKALGLGLLLAVAALSDSYAQRSPDTLPAITVDCYQSFAAKTTLPELPTKDVTLDAGSVEEPPIRYRLQVVKNTILKIIRDPTRDAFRKEHGKSVWEMTRDFTNRHQVVGWREELPGGVVRLFAFDFADLLLTTTDILPARSPAAGVEVHVMKCTRSSQ
jgi:hypothetical protein